MALDVYTSTGARLTSPQLPTYVTSLPSGPIDGQEIYYAADATNGVIWHLRYRAASSSSYKWEFVGGSALDVTSTTSPTAITATSPTSLSTNPTLTLPVMGVYQIEVFANGGAVQVTGGNKTAYLSIELSGGMTEAAVAAGGAALYVTATTLVAPMFASYLKTITGNSTVLTMKAWVDSGATFYPSNATSYPYGIRAKPVRVG